MKLLQNTTSNVTGVLVQINLSIPTQSVDSYIYIYIDITISNINLRFINIYCPNNAAERKIFLNDLELYLSTNKTLILGDFNFIEDIELDKNITNNTLGSTGRKIMESLKSDFDLIAIFRHLHPHEISFTWYNKHIYRRLDRFYISSSQKSTAEECFVQPFFFSDHDIVALKFRFKKPNVTWGPSFWKTNVTIFNHIPFIQDFDNLWHDFSMIENKDILWWDDFKENTKHLIIHHSKLINKEKTHTIRILEKSIRTLHQINSRTTRNVIDKIKDKEDQLRSLLLDKFAGSKIRSHSIELDNNDKSTRYFFKKEKSLQRSKQIGPVIQENNILETQSDIEKHCMEFYQNLYTIHDIDKNLKHYFLNNIPKN